MDVLDAGVFVSKWEARVPRHAQMVLWGPLQAREMGLEQWDVQDGGETGFLMHQSGSPLTMGRATCTLIFVRRLERAFLTIYFGGYPCDAPDAQRRLDAQRAVVECQMFLSRLAHETVEFEFMGELALVDNVHDATARAVPVHAAVPGPRTAYDGQARASQASQVPPVPLAPQLPPQLPFQPPPLPPGPTYALPAAFQPNAYHPGAAHPGAGPAFPPPHVPAQFQHPFPAYPPGMTGADLTPPPAAPPAAFPPSPEAAPRPSFAPSLGTDGPAFADRVFPPVSRTVERSSNGGVKSEPRRRGPLADSPRADATAADPRKGPGRGDGKGTKFDAFSIEAEARPKRRARSEGPSQSDVWDL